MLGMETSSCSPLQGVWGMCFQDGPPLRLDQQLCWLSQPEVLHTVPVVHLPVQLLYTLYQPLRVCGVDVVLEVKCNLCPHEYNPQ